MAKQEERTGIRFINSFVCKRAKGNRPFVLAAIGINIKDALAEIEELAQSEHCSKGWLNIEIKESKNGHIYAQHNTYTPKNDESPEEKVARLTAELKAAKAAKKAS